MSRQLVWLELVSENEDRLIFEPITKPRKCNLSWFTYSQVRTGQEKEEGRLNKPLTTASSSRLIK